MDVKGKKGERDGLGGYGKGKDARGLRAPLVGVCFHCG